MKTLSILKTLNCRFNSFCKSPVKRRICSLPDESPDDSEYEEFAKDFFPEDSSARRVLLIQPRIKWGFGKVNRAEIQLHLDEAIALVHSLPNWKVVKEVR